PAKCLEHLSYKTAEPFHGWEQKKYRPERDERVEQGGRVFRHVEHRKRSHHPVILGAPWPWIAIEISSAQQQEKHKRSEPENGALPLALRFGFQKDRPKPIADSHDAEPWQHRIGDPSTQAKGQGPRLMKHDPNWGKSTEFRGVHIIERIVTEEDQCSNGEHAAWRQKDQAGQHDH